MAKVKVVIFDLDGVIVSTDHYHYLAWKKIADRENIEFDELINNRLRGVSRMESLEIILEKRKKEYSEKEKIELATLKNSYYLELLKGISRKDLLSNVMKTLDELKSKGYLVAIGSSSKNAKTILKYLELDNYFDFISDGNNITRSKPHPDVFEYVTNHYNFNPSLAVVVEDARAGIDAANSAKMHSVAIGDANTYDKAEFRINDLSELLDCIESIK